MAACPEYDERLTLYAAGALDAWEAARVATHLESCAGCRAEAASSAQVLALVALPGPSARERAVAEALPRRTLAAWRGHQVRRAARRQWVGALLAAAAVVLVLLGPSLRGGGPAEAVAPRAEGASPAASDEMLESFEEWALRDPLAEALAPDLEETTEDSTEGEEGWDSSQEGRL